MSVITKNAAKCNHCGTVIESKYRHDFVGHSCAAMDGRFFAVDGGDAYIRRAYDLRSDFTNVSENSENKQ